MVNTVKNEDFIQKADKAVEWLTSIAGQSQIKESQEKAKSATDEMLKSMIIDPNLIRKPFTI